MSEKINWLLPCTACEIDHYAYAYCDKFTLTKAKIRRFVRAIKEHAANGHEELSVGWLLHELESIDQ